MPQHSYAVGDTVQVVWENEPRPGVYAGKVIRVGRGWVQVEFTIKGKRYQVNRVAAELKPLYVEVAR